MTSDSKIKISSNRSFGLVFFVVFLIVALWPLKYEAESEIAKIIINLCKKNNIFCIDLHNAIKFEYDDFYDLVHTTKKGTKKIAELIFLEMNNHDLP